MSEASNVVVVGVDGSPDSMHAVRWAGEYAKSFGHRVLLVAAWQWPPTYGYPMTFEGFDPEAEAHTTLEKATAELNGVEAGVVATEGPAGQILVHASEGAAVLVVGSHGHGAVSGILLGSVSTYAVHHATCPIAVIR